MNEENGNNGGKSYARIASDNKEIHIGAIKSDRGGFLPIGFDIVGDEEQINFIQNFKNTLNPFQIYSLKKGYG